MSLCEKCPLPVKAEYCCRSNPDTQAVKTFTNKATGELLTVCSDLQTDGSCATYYERPDACSGYECEQLYSEGLGASREYSN